MHLYNNNRNIEGMGLLKWLCPALLFVVPYLFSNYLNYIKNFWNKFNWSYINDELNILILIMCYACCIKLIFTQT